MTANELPYAEDAEVPQKAQKENELSRLIIGAAVEVQKELGVGLLESAYGAALAHEFQLVGIPYAREVPIEAIYKGAPVGIGYRADFVVAGLVIVELKVVDAIVPAHRSQLLSYLKMAGLNLGLVVNFNEFPVTRGVARVVNNL